MTADIQRALEILDLRLKAMLPEVYQDSYEDVQPVSMGSAGLKFDAEGKVAWNEIWGSFCDLAMAGGPPHKGMLLEPGTPEAIDAQLERYAQVVDEICRGVMMTTLLDAQSSPVPGWIRVECYSEAMAGWLLRAIVMENVAVRAQTTMLDLPAAPHFRLEKEIKNVITVIAKTSHYWLEHMSRTQQRGISSLFVRLAKESPLIEPAPSVDGHPGAAEQIISARMATLIEQRTGLHASSHRYAGWLGLECPSVGAAVWMMRAMVVSNVLARREGTVLFVPVNPASDPEGDGVIQTVVRIHELAAAKGALSAG
jgi:sirohydrochlorin cobaltochelatase